VRILITGADGQLGRDLLDALAGRVPVGGRRCALLGPEGPREGLRHDVLGTDIDTMPVDDRDAVLLAGNADAGEVGEHRQVGPRPGKPRGDPADIDLAVIIRPKLEQGGGVRGTAVAEVIGGIGVAGEQPLAGRRRVAFLAHNPSVLVLHLGGFAALCRKRWGESPSQALQR